MKDATWIMKLWGKGADTVMLTEHEMRKIRNIVENPSIAEALEHCLNVSQDDTQPLLDWITAAWRHAFPTMDLTQFEAAGKWMTYQEGIQLARKLGILYFIDNETNTPQAAPLIPQFKKIIIKKAPPHLRMSLAGPIQNCQTVAEAIIFFKNFGEMDNDIALSFTVSKKPRRFLQNIRKIKPLGKARTGLPIRPNQPWNPWRTVVEQRRKPFPQRPFLGYNRGPANTGPHIQIQQNRWQPDRSRSIPIPRGKNRWQNRWQRQNATPRNSSH